MEDICFLFLISFIHFIPPGEMQPQSQSQTQMVCPNQFLPIGRFCYYFSEKTKNWKGAEKACKKMGDLSNNMNIMLATLDFTGVPQDNQDLLSTIRDNHSKYWLGGRLKGEGDKARWRWLDNRPIHMTANYWREKSPNGTEGHECLAVSTHSKDADSKKIHTRASVIEKDCFKNYRYICQAACPMGFQLIGKYCYFFSSENKVSGLTWNEARKFCQGKSADLAVMGLDMFNDQKFLDIIANAGKKVYLGGSDRAMDNSWFWLDGRPIPLDSYFWGSSAPQSSATHHVIVAKILNTPTGENKAVLEDATSTEERQFVCQLLYTPPFGQMYRESMKIQAQTYVRPMVQIIPSHMVPGQSQMAPGQKQVAPGQIQVTPGQYQMVQEQIQVAPGQQTVGSLPNNPFIQSVQAPASEPIGSDTTSIGGLPIIGQPGVLSSAAGLPGDWQSDLTPNGVVDPVVNSQTDDILLDIPDDQYLQGLPTASTPTNGKVEVLLQAILNAEKEKGSQAASVDKKKVKKDTKEAQDSKEVYEIYDINDTYDSYDTENTDFNKLVIEE